MDRLILLALLLAAPPADRPDFSGSWVLDLSRSDAGQSTPDRATYQIRQHGDTLVYDRESSSTRGTTESHVVLGLDGKPWQNTVAQNAQDITTTSILTWQGDTLSIRSSGMMSGGSVDTDERWWLSKNAKGLLMHREVSVNGQIYATTNLYFNRKD